MCKDGEVLREEGEDSDARDNEIENHRGGGSGNTSSDSGHSVDQRGYVSEYEDQVFIHRYDYFQLYKLLFTCVRLCKKSKDKKKVLLYALNLKLLLQNFTIGYNTYT